MTDTDYWTSAPDRTVRGSMGLCHLTVAQAPFDVDARSLPPQDPERARAFAASFEGVEEVLEDLGARSVLTPLPSSVRADLDIVHAAAWGGTLSIAHPAFATDGNDEPLRSAARVLRERFPDARIVGRVTYYGGMEHTEDLVWLPDGAMFHASGWPGGEPFVVTGEPRAVIASLELKGWQLDNAGCRPARGRERGRVGVTGRAGAGPLRSMGVGGDGDHGIPCEAFRGFRAEYGGLVLRVN